MEWTTLPSVAIKRSFLLIFAGLFWCFGAAADAGSATVSFLPQWQPQAQFAGYYVAYEKGYYRDRGLEVRILRGGPDQSPSEMVAQGLADFATMFLARGIVQRARGVKLVNICQVAQNSALMLVARKSSGILKPEDINGKRVGLWGEDFQARLHAFFRKYQLKVQTVPQGTTLNLFLRGGVEVASAMRYNEYHLLLNAGLDPEELTTFPLAEHGLNFPEDGLYCLEQTFKDRPEVCRQFVLGSLEGWQYALAHPEEALDIVMKYVDEAHVPGGRAHQQWMLAQMGDLIKPRGGEAISGRLNREDYLQLAEYLRSEGTIKEVPDYARFQRDCGNADEK